MNNNNMNNNNMNCTYCQYNWKPRKKDPVACPRCKRYLWHKGEKLTSKELNDSLGPILINSLDELGGVPTGPIQEESIDEGLCKTCHRPDYSHGRSSNSCKKFVP